MYKDPVAGGKRCQITSHVTYKTERVSVTVVETAKMSVMLV